MDMKQIPAGKNPAEGQVNVFVEIPKDSDVKYELDKNAGVIFVDRFMFTAFSYPFNYGFVPNTLGEDGDPLDVMVLSEKPVFPGTVISSVVIGMLEMEDEAGVDTKVLAVPNEKIDPVFGQWTSIADVPEITKKKIKHFFDHMKELEPGKWVKTKDFLGKDQAIEVVQKALANAK